MPKISSLKPYLPFLIFIFYFNSISVFSEVVQLNEDKLKELLDKTTSPTLNKIEGMKAGEDLKYTSVYEMYGPSLFYQTQYADKAYRNRASLSSMYDGAQTLHQLGVRQMLPFGAAFEANIQNTTSRTNMGGFLPQMAGTRKEVTTSTEFKGTIDLWKNFLGKVDQARLSSLSQGKKIGELKREVELNRFKINMRKIYWRLVANQKSTEISEKLLKTSQVNSANVAARHRESLADVGDVARSNAAVSSRKGTLLALEFEKENLELALKNQIPTLTNEKIKLSEIDLDYYIAKVMVCINSISELTSIPISDTYFKEISDLINEKLDNEIKVENSHDKIDLKLVGSVYRDGQGNEFSNSRTDYNKKDRTDYSVGIMLEIPLDSRKSDTKENKIYFQKLMSEAESIDFENQMKTTHHFIVNSIQILVKAMQEQRDSKDNLDIRLKSMRKKYQQGRISINELMADEDQLLNVELSIVKTQLLIVETLLSYFEIFNRYDCPFNKF